jgi:hypothetical protein
LKHEGHGEHEGEKTSKSFFVFSVSFVFQAVALMLKRHPPRP